MSKATKADHAIRLLHGVDMSVAGDVMQFLFTDGSVMSLLIEEGDRKLTGIEHYEKALRQAEWLRDNGIMTATEYKRIDDRIMRMAGNDSSVKAKG